MDNEIRNQFGLTERDMKTILRMFRKYPEVLQVNIFGSRAKGNYKLGSDIDLAIMNEGVSEHVLTDIICDFEESSLPYRVDVLDISTLKHNDLIEHIKRVGVVLYKKGGS